MLVTNQTTEDYYFGPLHLAGGVGQQLTIDDTTSTSLYLTNDGVADAVNNAYLAGKITVSSQAQPFPRPTGTPQLLHGTGNPEAIVYAAQGSLYIRRDGTGANSVYTKTTGVTLATGWQNYTTAATGPGTTYRKTTPLAVNNTTTETDLLNGEITIGAGVMSVTALLRLTAYGDFLNNTGSTQGTPRLKLKFGATVLLDTGTIAASGTSATRGAWVVQATIANLGVASSQWVALRGSLQHGGANAGTPWTSFVTGSGTTVAMGMAGYAGSQTTWDGGNSGAVDTSVAETLALTAINSLASTSYETKLIGALVEII